MDSTNSPLDVNRVCVGRHCGFRSPRPNKADSLGELSTAAAALPASAHWSVLVRAAVRYEVAQRATRRIAPVTGITKGTTTMMKKTDSTGGKGEESSARLIDAKIKELNDWRGETLARIRKIIKQADPEVVEEVKWRGVPVWSHDGLICTGEVYKQHVKMTFHKGASLEDPSGLFNGTLGGNTWRAIDIHEDDKIDETALGNLIRTAVAFNVKSKSTPKARKASSKRAG